MKGISFCISFCVLVVFCCCFYLIGQQNGELTAIKNSLAVIKNSESVNGSVRTTQYSEQQGTQPEEHKEAKPAEDEDKQLQDLLDRPITKIFLVILISIFLICGEFIEVWPNVIEVIEILLLVPILTIFVFDLIYTVDPFL